MERKIVVCIGTDRNDGVRARLSLMIVDGETVLSEHYHSVTLLPGGDAAQARRMIEQHIAEPTGGVPGAPWPAIPDEEWAKLEGVLPVIHTPQAIARHAARVAAAEAKQKARGGVA